MSGAGRRVVLTLGVIACLSTGACREEEQGRILIQEKGVYQGPADVALTEEQVRDLRSRANLQNF